MKLYSGPISLFTSKVRIALAEKGLDLCIVDEDSKPIVQTFRMDLGQSINPTPFPEKLIGK